MNNKKYVLINLLEKEALFSYERMMQSDIPEGFYKYDIRHGADWEPLTVETEKVHVDYLGSVLIPEPLSFNGKEYITLGHADFGYLSEELTAKQYLRQYGLGIACKSPEVA